eukprot:15458633-Alexandrium_andersonii.AAC.2
MHDWQACARRRRARAIDGVNAPGEGVLQDRGRHTSPGQGKAFSSEGNEPAMPLRPARAAGEGRPTRLRLVPASSQRPPEERPAMGADALARVALERRFAGPLCAMSERSRPWRNIHWEATAQKGGSALDLRAGRPQ